MIVQVAVIVAMAANAAISVVLAQGEIIPKPYGLLLAAVNAGLVVLINQLPAVQKAGATPAHRARRLSDRKDLGSTGG